MASQGQLLITMKSGTPDKRNPNAEKALSDRLAEIDTRIAEIDKQLAKDFPDYAALVSPKPISIADVQSQLRDGEALVLFLDTPEWKPTPEETFIWVVTKTESRWVKSFLGTQALQDRVAALRCGLDGSSWVDPAQDPEHWPEASEADKARTAAQRQRLESCKALVPEHDTAGVSPPFNLKIAHELYAELLGPVADLIKDKQLLIVPSGPLTSLPFSVLVTEEPKAAFPARNEDYKEAAWLIRDHAITVLPSVASLAALRRNAKTSAGRAPLPWHRQPAAHRRGWHQPNGLGETDLSRSPPAREHAGRRRSALAQGGHAGSAGGGGVGGDIEALRHLEPLPNTRDELCAIGLSLGADKERDHSWQGGDQEQGRGA